MKKLLSILLAVCLLLPFASAAAQEPSAAGASMTRSLLEQIETAYAFTISFVISADDDAVQTLYFQGDACASDYRSARFPLTVRSLYIDEKGYLFLPALPLFYLPADASSAVRRTAIPAELHAAVDGRQVSVGTLTLNGVEYTAERFCTETDQTTFCCLNGQLKLIAVGNPGEPGGIVVTVESYAFSVPDRVFRAPLISLGGLFPR